MLVLHIILPPTPSFPVPSVQVTLYYPVMKKWASKQKKKDPKKTTQEPRETKSEEEKEEKKEKKEKKSQKSSNSGGGGGKCMLILMFILMCLFGVPDPLQKKRKKFARRVGAFARTVLLTVSPPLSIGALAMGIIHRLDCQQQELLPYWLIGTGGAMVLLFWMELCRCAVKKPGCCMSSIAIFQIILLLGVMGSTGFGSYLMYQHWPFTDPSACHEGIWKTALGMLALEYVTVVFWIIVALIMCIVSKLPIPGLI